jgi:hypothetical protein
MNQNLSILISLLHIKTKTKSLKSFNVHHKTKPKSIHFIATIVTYLDFQLQKSIAPTILCIFHANQFHYVHIEVHNFIRNPIEQFQYVQKNVVIRITFR